MTPLSAKTSKDRVGEDEQGSELLADEEAYMADEPAGDSDTQEEEWE
jgi:hypothetical protein